MLISTIVPYETISCRDLISRKTYRLIKSEIQAIRDLKTIFSHALKLFHRNLFRRYSISTLVTLNISHPVTYLKDKIMEDPREISGPIAQIYRNNIAYMAKELELHRVGSGQFEFLLLLYHENGVSQEIISKKLKVSKATSARAVQSLEKEGYVYRERDKTDLRAYRVYLTEKGKEMRDIIFKKQTSFITILFSDFTFEEKEIFRLLIHKASIKLFEPGFEPPWTNRMTSSEKR